MAYKSLQEIEERCRAEGISFSEAVLLDDLNERGVSREDSRTTMHGMWKAMKEASDGYDAALRSNSGLVGGAGGKMREYVEKEEPLSGGFVGKVISSALEMGESNACMKRIVAAPTAGACGVLPAVLVNYQREWKASDEEIVDALYVAAGIGQVIASRAFIAGALGGCQAEIGSASAMAAGALVVQRENQKIRETPVNAGALEGTIPVETAQDDAGEAESTDGETRKEEASDSEETSEASESESDAQNEADSDSAQPTMQPTAIAGTSYTVADGDTLAGISRRFYNSLAYVNEICRINGIEDADMIYPGMTITLP